MTWQHNLDAISRRSSQQSLDLFLRGRGGGRSAWWDRHADFKEHLLKPGWGNGNQHLGRFAALVQERGLGADRHVGEHPGAGDVPLVANCERDVTFEDIEALFLLAMDVRGWPAAGGNECFKQGVLAVRVFAGRQEV